MRSGRPRSGRAGALRALNNLVDNAIKYTPAGSRSISPAAGRGQARIVVRDTGIGIDRPTPRASSIPSCASTRPGAATRGARGWGWPWCGPSSKPTAAPSPWTARRGRAAASRCACRLPEKLLTRVSSSSHGRLLRCFQQVAAHFTHEEDDDESMAPKHEMGLARAGSRRRGSRRRRHDGLRPDEGPSRRCGQAVGRRPPRRPCRRPTESRSVGSSSRPSSTSAPSAETAMPSGSPSGEETSIGPRTSSAAAQSATSGAWARASSSTPTATS